MQCFLLCLSNPAQIIWGMLLCLLPGCCGLVYAESSRPRRVGELVFALALPPSHLNPAIASGIAIGIPGAQLFASPLRFDEHWQPQPYLARAWEFSEDNLSLTLHLVESNLS